jgi:L-seryl-tRNA(Ser) seleniumtransferase
VERLRKDPLARAMRPDKVVLAALAATLRLYRGGVARRDVPVWRQLGASAEALEARARAIANSTGTRAITSEATIGGGSLPGQTLASWAIAIDTRAPQRLLARLRAGVPAVIGRVVDDRVLLDLRTVEPADDERLARSIIAAIA